MYEFDVKACEKNLFKHRYYLGLLSSRYYEIEGDLMLSDESLSIEYAENGSIKDLRKRLKEEQKFLTNYIRVHERTIEVTEIRIRGLKQNTRLLERLDV